MMGYVLQFRVKRPVGGKWANYYTTPHVFFTYEAARADLHFICTCLRSDVDFYDFQIVDLEEEDVDICKLIIKTESFNVYLISMHK